jgi:serine/threonine protein kinase
MKTKTWKISDFGLTMDGTSVRAITTLYSRGTASYRAPELIKEESKYNNKVDIWAFGCVAFELATGTRAFASDFSVREYAVSDAELHILFSNYYNQPSRDNLLMMIK